MGIQSGMRHTEDRILTRSLLGNDSNAMELEESGSRAEPENWSRHGVMNVTPSYASVTEGAFLLHYWLHTSSPKVSAHCLGSDRPVDDRLECF